LYLNFSLINSLILPQLIFVVNHLYQKAHLNVYSNNMSSKEQVPNNESSRNFAEFYPELNRKEIQTAELTRATDEEGNYQDIWQSTEIKITRENGEEKLVNFGEYWLGEKLVTEKLQEQEEYIESWLKYTKSTMKKDYNGFSNSIFDSLNEGIPMLEKIRELARPKDKNILHQNMDMIVPCRELEENKDSILDRLVETIKNALSTNADNITLVDVNLEVFKSLERKFDGNGKSLMNRLKEKYNCIVFTPAHNQVLEDGKIQEFRNVIITNMDNPKLSFLHHQVDAKVDESSNLLNGTFPGTFLEGNDEEKKKKIVGSLWGNPFSTRQNRDKMFSNVIKFLSNKQDEGIENIVMPMDSNSYGNGVDTQDGLGLKAKLKILGSRFMDKVTGRETESGFRQKMIEELNQSRKNKLEYLVPERHTFTGHSREEWANAGIIKKAILWLQEQVVTKILDYPLDTTIVSKGNSRSSFENNISVNQSLKNSDHKAINVHQSVK
jgi:hypothetical protein